MLSVSFEGQVFHIVIRFNRQGQFAIDDGPGFAKVASLVEYYSSGPHRETPTLLKQSIAATAPK